MPPLPCHSAILRTPTPTPLLCHIKWHRTSRTSPLRFAMADGTKRWDQLPIPVPPPSPPQPPPTQLMHPHHYTSTASTQPTNHSRLPTYLPHCLVTAANASTISNLLWMLMPKHQCLTHTSPSPRWGMWANINLLQMPWTQDHFECPYTSPSCPRGMWANIFQFFS